MYKDSYFKSVLIAAGVPVTYTTSDAMYFLKKNIFQSKTSAFLRLKAYQKNQ
jgi:hypothetical protein